MSLSTYDHWKIYGTVPRTMTGMADRRHRGAAAPLRPVIGHRCEYCGHAGLMRAQRNGRAACVLCDIWIGIELNRDKGTTK